MLKGAWAVYVKRRRHETRGLRREKRVVLKGGSAPRSADEDPSARRIAAVAAAGGPVVCRLSSDIDRIQAGNPFMSLSFARFSMLPRLLVNPGIQRVQSYTCLYLFARKILCKVYVGDLIEKRHLISAEINIEVQCFIFFFFFIEWFNKIIPFNKENFMIEKFF